MNQATFQRALVGADFPVIGPRGQFTFRDHTVFLSERDAMLASVLVYHFASEVTDIELLDRVWPDGTTRWMLLHHLHKLQRRLTRLGLSIVEVPERSHVLRPVDTAAVLDR